MTSREINTLKQEEQIRELETEKDKLIEQEIDEFKGAIDKNFDLKDAVRIYDVLDLIIELHSDQENRLDGKPFFSHPMQVANDVVDKYKVRDPDIVIAALLHDAVEDQNLKLFIKRLEKKFEGIWRKKIKIEDPSILKTKDKKRLMGIALREIDSLYGNKVKKIVENLSNPDFDSLIKGMELKGIKKSKNELYKEHIEKVIKDPDVCVVKYADFAINSRVVSGHKKKHFIEKYGPVIKEVFLPFFRAITETHPLYGQKEKIIQEIEANYEKQYLEY